MTPMREVPLASVIADDREGTTEVTPAHLQTRKGRNEPLASAGIAEQEGKEYTQSPAMTYRMCK